MNTSKLFFNSLIASTAMAGYAINPTDAQQPPSPPNMLIFIAG
jgi:hypothetical protein